MLAKYNRFKFIYLNDDKSHMISKSKINNFKFKSYNLKHKLEFRNI